MLFKLTTVKLTWENKFATTKNIIIRVRHLQLKPNMLNVHTRFLSSCDNIKHKHLTSLPLTQIFPILNWKGKD
jgi:hypothetical protein